MKLDRQRNDESSRTLDYSRGGEKCWVFFKEEGAIVQCRQKMHSNFHLKRAQLVGQGRAGRSFFQKIR